MAIRKLTRPETGACHDARNHHPRPDRPAITTIGQYIYASGLTVKCQTCGAEIGNNCHGMGNKYVHLWRWPHWFQTGVNLDAPLPEPYLTEVNRAMLTHVEPVNSGVDGAVILHTLELTGDLKQNPTSQPIHTRVMHEGDLTGHLLGGSKEEWDLLCLPMNYQPPSDVPPLPIDPTKPNLSCPPRMISESNRSPMTVKPPIQILKEDELPTPENLARDYNAACPMQGIEYRYIDGLTYMINVPAFTFEEAIARLEAAVRNGKHIGQLEGTIPAVIPGARLLADLICWFQNLIGGGRSAR